MGCRQARGAELINHSPGPGPDPSPSPNSRPNPNQAPKLQRLRVPARPHLKYPREWQGYDRWLGLPETPLTVPAGFGGAGADVDAE